MSQLAHSSVQLVRSHRNITLAALLALLATVAIVLIIAIGGESTSNSSDVGVVSSQPTSHPDESNVAAAVTGSSASTTADNRPDESNVAAAVTGSSPSTSSDERPDESAVGQAVAP